MITQEHSILKEERKLNSEFALVEREERDSFAALSSSLKDSHEKERAQANRTKYWSIIGSIIGTVIGIAGSSISNEFKMKELRKIVSNKLFLIILRKSKIGFFVTHFIGLLSPKMPILFNVGFKCLTGYLWQEKANKQETLMYEIPFSGA